VRSGDPRDWTDKVSHTLTERDWLVPEPDPRVRYKRVERTGTSYFIRKPKKK
jgi:hypothetical protein